MLDLLFWSFIICAGYGVIVSIFYLIYGNIPMVKELAQFGIYMLYVAIGVNVIEWLLRLIHIITKYCQKHTNNEIGSIKSYRTSDLFLSPLLDSDKPLVIAYLIQAIKVSHAHYTTDGNKYLAPKPSHKPIISKEKDEHQPNANKTPQSYYSILVVGR